MFKRVKVNLYLVFILAIAFTLAISSTHLIAGPEDPFSEVKVKMAGISEKERETLQKLFIHVQEIEEMEREEKEAVRDLETIKAEIKDLQGAIAAEEIAYAKMRGNLKQVLTSYQKMGPGSYLEIVLKSDDLPDLLRRINTLRDLTHGTGELLERIKESAEKQSAEKIKLAEKLTLMEYKQQDLVQALAKKRKLKEDLENYLASLVEERGHYQAYLDSIQKTWAELKPFFSKTIKDFSRTIEMSDLPPDALKITFNLFSIKVSIYEKTLNDIVKGDPRLPEMVFAFHPGKVEMRLPEKNLLVSGKFVVFDGHSLKFQVEEGSFSGMPLGTGAISELFQDGSIVLNLEPQLGSSTLNSLEIMDGYMDLSIKP